MLSSSSLFKSSNLCLSKLNFELLLFKILKDATNSLREHIEYNKQDYLNY